jgi:MFS family permease
LSQSAIARAPTSAARLTLLVALAMFITYVDRGNLGTALPLVEKELGLSPEQLGRLGSAFYLTYALAMIPAGWLAERFGARVVLAGGLIIWSLATTLMGFAGSFATLLLLRLMLGLGESAAFPCMSKLLATAVDHSRIGLANGVIAFGYLIGPAAGTLAGGLLMAQFGWRPVFVLFGALSLLWLLPWRRTVVAPVVVTAGAPSGPPFREILRQRGLWGASLGHFASNYTFYFILFWLPEYLVKERGMSISTMAAVASGAYLVNALAAIGAGWATDRWTRSGRSRSLAYKSIMALNHCMAIGCMFGIVLLPAGASIACLYAYQLTMGFASPGTFAIAQILAGPKAAGRWVGVQNMCGNIAGIGAPWITGLILGATGHYERAFGLAALINVLGLLGWVVILPRIAPILWRQRSAT